MVYLGVSMLSEGVWRSSTWLDVEHGNRELLFVLGLASLYFNVVFWFRTVRHRLSADEEGIVERTGIRTTRVRWSNVAYYRMERVRGTQERLFWPVLYGADGRELLRPACRTIRGGREGSRRLEALWGFVEEQLEGRKRDGPTPLRLSRGAMALLIGVDLAALFAATVGVARMQLAGRLTLEGSAYIVLGLAAMLSARWCVSGLHGLKSFYVRAENDRADRNTPDG